MSYRIRSVDGEDEETADTLRYLHQATFGSSAPQIEPHLDYWWLVTCDKEPVGFAGLSKARYTRDTGYLKRSGVLPEHRGNDLQYRMIKVRERKARKLGWTVLVTDTTDNPRSSNTLIRAGYRIYQPQQPWAYPESIYWRKRLT